MKVALVTGGAYGIGLAIVERFLADGWNVAVVAEVRPTEVLDLVGRQGPGSNLPRALPIVIDFSEGFEAAAECVRRTVDHFGHVDAVVNNAGVTLDASLSEMTPNDVTRLVNVNLLSVIAITQAAASAMRGAGRGGSIV